MVLDRFGLHDYYDVVLTATDFSAADAVVEDPAELRTSVFELLDRTTTV